MVQLPDPACPGGGETNLPPGSHGRSGHVGEANLDEFEQRAAFEERKKEDTSRTESFNVCPPKIVESPRSASVTPRLF